LHKFQIKYKKHFELCDELLSLALQALPVIPAKSKTYGEAITSFFIKGINSFRSVIVLCKEGLGDDAGLIVRSMFNLAVLVEWVEEDKENRAKRYIGWLWKEKIDLAKSLGNTASKEEEKEWDKVRGLFEYKDKKGAIKCFRNWYGNKNIRDLAKSLKETRPPPNGYSTHAEYHYIDAYKPLSKIDHSDPLASIHFLQRTKGLYLTGYLSQGELIHLNLKGGFQYFYIVFSTWNSQFGKVPHDVLKNLFEIGEEYFRRTEEEDKLK